MVGIHFTLLVEKVTAILSVFYWTLIHCVGIPEARMGGHLCILLVRCVCVYIIHIVCVYMCALVLTIYISALHGRVDTIKILKDRSESI